MFKLFFFTWLYLIAPSCKLLQTILNSSSPSWVFWARQCTSICCTLSSNSKLNDGCLGFGEPPGLNTAFDHCPVCTGMSVHGDTRVQRMCTHEMFTPDNAPTVPTDKALSCKWFSFPVGRKVTSKDGSLEERWIHKITTESERWTGTPGGLQSDPHHREGWTIHTDDVVQGFAQLGLESSQGHMFASLSWWPVRTLHFLNGFFFFIPSWKLTLYLVVWGSFYVWCRLFSRNSGCKRSQHKECLMNFERQHRHFQSHEQLPSWSGFCFSVHC